MTSGVIISRDVAPTRTTFPRQHPRAEAVSSSGNQFILKRRAKTTNVTSMDDAPTTKDYIDRSMDAVRAQNDARFAEVLSEIRDIRGLISSKPSTWQLVATVFAGAATILGVALAALSYGGDRFDGGVNLADQRQEQIQRDAEQDAIIRRLDALLAAQPTPSDRGSGSPTE